VEEKTKRNEQIYLDKMGFKNVYDQKPSRKGMSFRELTKKYNLSTTFLQTKVTVYKARFLKTEAKTD